MSAVTKVKKMNLKNKLTSCSLAMILCLGACDQNQKTQQVIDQRAGEAQQGLEQAIRTPPSPVSYNPLTVSSKVWSGSTAQRMQHGMPLPSRYEDPRGIALVAAEAMTLADIANAITQQTGIPVRLTSLSLGGKLPPSGAAPAQAASGPLSVSGLTNSLAGGTSQPPVGGAPSSSSAAGGADPVMSVSYEGSLSGLLERVSACFGVSWHYDGSSIQISRYQTRVFTVEALPTVSDEVNEGLKDPDGGQSQASSNSTSSSSGGGTGQGMTITAPTTLGTFVQNRKYNFNMKYWDEITQVLNAMVAGQGTVVVSPSLGIVTVTTTPEAMETIAEYIGKENKRESRQIAINVQIYSVNIGQSEDFTMAFSGFLKNLSKFSGLNYSTAATPGITNQNIGPSSFGSLSVAILNGPNDPTAHASDVFNALSTIGNTTTVAQFPMTTLNNHPVSRRIGTNTTIISSVTSTASTAGTTGSGFLTFIPNTSIVPEGFTLQLTPRLLDDGRIMLDYTLGLTSLVSLGATTFNTGAGTTPIDLPKIDSRVFVQQSMVRSGSTLIIGGVDQENLAQNKSGVGSPDNYLLGGGTSSNNNHLMMFIAITPQVMEPGEERS